MGFTEEKSVGRTGDWWRCMRIR